MIDLTIDPGHGGSDPGAIGPTGLQEKEVNLKIAFKVGELLQKQGLNINYTRTADTGMGLSARAKFANNSKAKYFLSIHNNAAENSAASGIETFALAPGGNGEKLAKAIRNNLVSVLGLVNRGVKFANFAVLRETDMPAALVEVCFISNPKEEALLRDDQFLDKAATAIAKGVLDFLGQQWKEDVPGTPVLGPASATVAQAQEWARQNGAPQEFIDLAPLYWKIAQERAGVDPAIAYVQFAHETGFLYRDGKSMAGIDASWKNPCGLKTTEGGSNTNPSAHKKFESWEEGITAQIDHLALYAGAKGYPRQDTPDPRHFSYIAGKAPTVEELGGKWAPSLTYGEKLVAILKELQGVKVPEVKPEIQPKTIRLKIDGDCGIEYNEETKEIIFTL